MPALPSSLISSLSAAPAVACVPDSIAGLPEALASVPDPRARRGVRHRLTVVVTAAVCPVVAGCRSYTAIAEWVADLPEQSAGLLGIDTQRRPSEAMIRRLLQALDHDQLSTAIGSWLATHASTPAPGQRRAIAVDGKTLRGSRTAERGAHGILTGKQNQPHLHAQLAALPWRAVPDADRDTARGHGRREIRTLKILSVSTGIDFPNAAQTLQIRRRRRRLDQPNASPPNRLRDHRPARPSSPTRAPRRLDRDCPGFG
jgi:hypothetical protein